MIVLIGMASISCKTSGLAFMRTMIRTPCLSYPTVQDQVLQAHRVQHVDFARQVSVLEPWQIDIDHDLAIRAAVGVRHLGALDGREADAEKVRGEIE